MPFDKRHMAACLEFSKPYRCGWCWDGCSPVSAEDCWSSIKSDCCVLGHLHEQRLSFPVTHFGWTAKMVQTTSQTLRQLLDKMKAWKQMFYKMCPLSQLSAESSLESIGWFKPWHSMWTVETCILMYMGCTTGYVNSNNNVSICMHSMYFVYDFDNKRIVWRLGWWYHVFLWSGMGICVAQSRAPSPLFPGATESTWNALAWLLV